MLIRCHAPHEVAMSDRLQKEIEELLGRIDTFPPRRPLWIRVRDTLTSPYRSARRWLRDLGLPRVTPGHILLTAIAIIIVAWVAEPGGSSVTRYLIVGGIILFITAFVLSLRRQSNTPQKRWRGEPLDLSGPTATTRLRSWWSRRRPHR
jgi:hypothetical protein